MPDELIYDVIEYSGAPNIDRVHVCIDGEWRWMTLLEAAEHCGRTSDEMAAAFGRAIETMHAELSGYDNFHPSDGGEP